MTTVKKKSKLQAKAAESKKNPGKEPTRSGSSIVSRKLDLSKFRKTKLSYRSRASEIRRRHRERYSGKELAQINWTEVHAGFLSSIDVGSAEWKHLHSVLSRNCNDRERRALLRKLGNEVGEIYSRYRRATERREGRIGEFNLMPEEFILARRLAENCILRGIHPSKLIEFWDSRIASFTNMKFPTLAFLKSPTAVDEALAASDAKPGQRTRTKASQAPAIAQFGNSFSDTGGLDRRLRPALESAGFPTQEYNDRFLLTVQHMAVQLANGKRFFIAPGPEKKMAIWAAKHLYVQAKAG